VERWRGGEVWWSKRLSQGITCVIVDNRKPIKQGLKGFAKSGAFHGLQGVHGLGARLV